MCSRSAAARCRSAITATAFKVFDAIVHKAPNFAEGWNKRATVYYMMGNYEAWLADIDRVLELEPHISARWRDWASSTSSSIATRRRSMLSSAC